MFACVFNCLYDANKLSLIISMCSSNRINFVSCSSCIYKYSGTILERYPLSHSRFLMAGFLLIVATAIIVINAFKLPAIAIFSYKWIIMDTANAKPVLAFFSCPLAMSTFTASKMSSASKHFIFILARAFSAIPFAANFKPPAIA